MTASETTPGVANEFYKPEEATDFFRELEAGLRLLPDYRRLYGVYSHVFQKCIDQKINATRLNFSGTFAKTDYLLKEHQAPKTLVRAANHTRSRLRQREELTDDDLRENYLQDLRNLCRFIACVYEAEIPESLAARFPREEREQSRRELKSECMRVIIDSWDKDHIYVNAEDADGDLLKVDYRKTGFYNQGDWSYMEPLFYQNAQLNLVRPGWEDDVLYPELIILEPDYLVDISAIARCFTPYAESPYVNLMKRMEPSQATEATVLGNLAGQLLDETIHQRPGTHTYRQSVKDFFKDNAISLLEANPGGQFHTEAQRQKCNIQRALDDGMRKGNFQNFDSKDGLVEPSFFSEMLGIQGRMDYLQFDFKFLIEQKSGKGEFPYDNFVKPRHREEPYVQLQL